MFITKSNNQFDAWMENNILHFRPLSGKKYTYIYTGKAVNDNIGKLLMQVLYCRDWGSTYEEIVIADSKCY